MARIVVRIESIVKDYYHTEFDDELQDYYRFIAHLKFFAQRLLRKEHYDDESEEFLEAVKVKYPKAYQCAEKIRAFIESEYSYEFDRSELLYLSVHINRIVKNL